MMRPSPQDVRTWFSGDVEDDAFADHVITLRADPNWDVVYTPGPPTWQMRLVYLPTGEIQRITLRRIGALCWRVIGASSQ